MSIEKDNNVLGVDSTTQSTQFKSIPTAESALIMSTRSIELEGRYQQVLERRIHALENQLASIEHAKLQGVEADTVASGTVTKVEKDKQTSSDTTKMVDDSGDLECKVGSKSHGQKTVMIFDQLESAWKHENPKAEDEATTKPKKDSDPETQCAFKFIEYYTEKSPHRTYDHSGIEISSKELISKLKETLEQDRGQPWDATDGSLRSPYKSIVYSWDKLIEQTVTSETSQFPGSDSENDRARETCEALADMLECIRTARELKDYFKNRDTNIASQVTSCKYLWTLFPPATRVVASPFMGNQQLFLVEDLEEIKKSRYNHESYLHITCICLNFDTSFSRRISDSISSIFRSSIFSDPPSLMGLPPSSDHQSRNLINVRQVIVDHRAWNHWGPGNEIPNMGDATALPFDSSDWLTSTIHKYSLHSIASRAFEDRCKNGDLLNEEYALLPARLLGYIPVKKIFAQLAVKHLSSVEDKDKDEVWNSGLILNEDKKKIIRTLVENHAQMAHKRIPDLVEGKGNGLVILLHGPPGVGKSLTAECVAKATSKPLFTVGVADIGTQSKDVEDKLNKVFSLAAEWDAVLLIDEADVFMEQRGSTDSTLERNALVSVLLRVLEYYEGILILTTNRVLSFDVAVQSRIHLAVMFHDLDDDQTRAIIEVHLAKRPHDLTDSELDNFSNFAATSALNGRQIRNVISSAEAMVNRRASKRITFKDIKSVLNHTKEFQQSLQEYSKQQRYNNEAQGRKRG
ncbi:MAG: hypothetical protein Q9213_001522 [Squamulea squamosa]